VRSALFALGFRPLYLAAGAFAAISVAAWAGVFAGWVPPGYLHGHPLWHAHEMIFGYAFAVIVGFLFTAGANWTRQPTPSGAWLAAIVACWVVARFFALSPLPWISLPFDLAFALAAAIGLAIPLWRARNSRNYFFVALLVAIGLLNLAFHLAILGRIDANLSRVIGIALDIVLFIMVVMAGRVIPMFTNNAVPGAGARRSPALERAALGAVLVLAVADVLALPSAVVAAVAGFAAIAHGWRLMLWNPWSTRAKPILWILHAAYAWIVVHLALRAAVALGWTAPTLAAHALTVGAIGGLTLGMMTRTSRGHTGRVLETGPAETAAYGLVMAAAAVRVFVPMIPGWTMPAIVLSGLLWAVAFALFTIAYWPILSRPRLDGKPG
jgi:uncharacterized protein involved in response to NO